MPIVPTTTAPSVAPTITPTVRQEAPGALAAAMTQGGRELSALGQAATGTGAAMYGELARQHFEINESTVKDYDTKLMGAIQGVLYGTPDAPDRGYTAQKGKTAVDTYEATVAKLNGLGVELSKDLTNPAQQEMAKQVTARRVQAAVLQATQYRDEQNNVWQKTAGEVRIRAAVDGAPLAYNPVTDRGQAMTDDGTPEANSQYQLYLRTVRSETIAQAQRAGMDEGTTTELVKNNLAKAYAGTLAHLIDRKSGAPGDLAVAKKLFGEVKDQLPAETQDKVRALLEAGSKKDQALSLSLEVQAAHGDISAQQKDLDERFKAGKIDSETHGMALQLLRATNSQRRAEQGEQDKAVIGQAWDIARKGGGLASMSPSQIDYIKRRGLGPSIDAIFKRADGDGPDDSRLYSELMRMSAEDPRAFAEMDLAKLSGQMSKGRWNRIVEIQTGINRNDLKVVDQTKLRNDTMRDVRASLLAAGFDLTPKEGSQKAKDLEAFTASVHDALSDAEPVWQEKKLTRQQKADEARKITLGMLKEQALAGTGWFGSGFGQTSKPVWRMTAEERAAPWDVPAAERAQITAALKRAGRPVTEDAIQNAYKIGQGLR